jgi:hypothetical protein
MGTKFYNRFKAVIGVIFVVASLLKLATIWHIIHWSWFERMSEEPGGTYLAIFILIFVGINLIFEGTKRNT